MANIMLQTLPQVRNSIMKAASWTSVSDAGDSSSGDWIPRLFCLPEHVFSGHGTDPPPPLRGERL
eukprot:3624872-Amphidinium_carterae.1